MATMQMCKPVHVETSHCDQTNHHHNKITHNNHGGCKSSEKTQTCKPTHVETSHCDQNKHHKITPATGGCKSSEKKHQGHFWHRHGAEHKNNSHVTNKNNHHQHHDQAASHPEHKRGGKLTQCFGGQKPTSFDYDAEEGMVVVIEKKEERITIVHAKKSHDHHEGEKHLNRC